jgi:dye decolorizing peroxidase
MNDERGVSRRRILQGGAVLLGGAALGATAVAVGSADPAATDPQAGGVAGASGTDTISFTGVHQAGVETPQQAHVWFVALDLRPDAGRDGLSRLLRLWTDDAARLTQGRAPLADQERELTTTPARLTVTVGLGATAFDKVGLAERRPPSLAALPPFEVDRLDPRWGEADLLLQVAGDDVLTISHAVRILTRDARTFADVRWIQRGFSRTPPVVPEGTTPRNALGQVDGTVNPVPGSDDFSDVVWSEGEPAWFAGGTMLVLRRIRMELDTWDELGRADREQVIGRRLSDGAPITGGTEQTPVDLEATDDVGLPIVGEIAHVRRARATSPAERMLRRGWSYDDSPGTDSISDAGLLFCAYVADVDRQFVPVQRRLAEADLLNTWITPVGSAVFAILPGVTDLEAGDHLGRTLLA